MLAWLLATCAWPGNGAHAATYNVGTGSGCTHATVQAAIDAAEASAGADTVRISRSLGYTGQALVLTTSQSVYLLGGLANCADATGDGTFTVIDGAGGATEPVLRITGNTGAIVRLQYLTVRNGDEDGSGKGGGIYFRGNGSLQLSDSAIINNLAGLGGGIYAEGSGSDAELLIGANVTISGNTARYNGGGVFAEALELAMLEPGSLIAFNEAQGVPFSGSVIGGYGGGLVVNSTLALAGYAYIGSGGIGTLGAIHGNTARYGGGVAVLGESGSDLHAYLQLFTTQPDRAAAVRDNFAAVAGGGLYLRPDIEAVPHARSYASAELWNAVLDGNAAPEGAAVYLDSDTDGSGFSTGGFLTANGASPPTGALPCPADAHCGGITGNLDLDANGQATGGAVIRMQAGSSFRITDFLAPDPGGLLIEGNRGGRLFDLRGGGDFEEAELYASNLLIGGNQLGGALVYGSSADVRIDDSTIAGNSIGAAELLLIDGDVTLRRSILWQPGETMLVQVGGTRTVEQVIASEVASLGGGPAAIVAEPRFIDPARGDYRLRAASPAIDYAAPVTGDDRDAHGRPRDQRIEVVPRTPGRVRDLGAFERPSLQPLVLNADFDTDLNLWPEVAPVLASWDGSQNVSGPAGSGSALVSDADAAQLRVTGMSQCIHLPGPGRYGLNGWGRSGPAPTRTERDAVLLYWEYRRNGTEACNAGPADASGDHFLTALNAWNRPADPLLIDVPEGEWSHQSSISVALVVVDAGVSVPFSVTGWFDGVSLELVAAGSDLFADGFEEP